eukprot:gene10063-7957_t
MSSAFVLFSDAQRRRGLLNSDRPSPQPLFKPKGSTRSMVRMAIVSITVFFLMLVCWTIYFQAAELPQEYFGGRRMGMQQQGGESIHSSAVSKEGDKTDILDETQVDTHKLTVYPNLDGVMGESYEAAPAPHALFPSIETILPRPNLDPSSYTIPIKHGSSRNKALHKLREYISSEGFRERMNATAAAGTRGILINAGGSKLVADLIISLKVIRETFKCGLPIEVAWQGPHEMDAQTWYNLQKQYGPLRGFDIQSEPNPSAEFHQHVQLEKYVGKVYSLLLSNFSEVLMLDADCIPVQHPETWFSHPEYKRVGNLFWPDAWTDKVHDTLYSDFGLNETAKALLLQGRGYSKRDTESGQLVINRGRHLDTLEYIFFINSFPGLVQESAWGDKDTYAVGFALAGKAHEFSQSPVPPGGLFAWRKDMLLIKSTEEKTWGWQLLGFLQFDNWGRAAFIHRTINKFDVDKTPWNIELVSAPMPRRWAEYYLVQVNPGPTKGIPWDYVVPASSVSVLTIPPTLQEFSFSNDSWHEDASQLVSSIAQGCPVPTFLSYWQMREACLPVGVDDELDKICEPFLNQTLGAKVLKYSKKGWLTNPQLKYLDADHMTSGTYFTYDSKLEVKVGAEIEPPIPAWRPDFHHPLVRSNLSTVVLASYEAHSWMLENMADFPILTAIIPHTTRVGMPSRRLPRAKQTIKDVPDTTKGETQTDVEQGQQEEKDKERPEGDEEQEEPEEQEKAWVDSAIKDYNDAQELYREEDDASGDINGKGYGGYNAITEDAGAGGKLQLDKGKGGKEKLEDTGASETLQVDKGKEGDEKLGDTGASPKLQVDKGKEGDEKLGDTGASPKLQVDKGKEGNKKLEDTGAGEKLQVYKGKEGNKKLEDTGAGEKLQVDKGKEGNKKLEDTGAGEKLQVDKGKEGDKKLEDTGAGEKLQVDTGKEGKKKLGDTGASQKLQVDKGKEGDKKLDVVKGKEGGEKLEDTGAGEKLQVDKGKEGNKKLGDTGASETLQVVNAGEEGDEEKEVLEKMEKVANRLLQDADAVCGRGGQGGQGLRAGQGRAGPPAACRGLRYGSGSSSIAIRTLHPYTSASLYHLIPLSILAPIACACSSFPPAQPPRQATQEGGPSFRYFVRVSSRRLYKEDPSLTLSRLSGLLSDCVHTGAYTAYQAACCLVSLQGGLIESLALECGQGATGLDIERLFRACSPSSGNIRTLMFCFDSEEIQSWTSSALNSLPLGLRQTLVTLEIARCYLDGPAFLTLADCHNLTAVDIVFAKLTSPEAAESITSLTQLRFLRFQGYLKVDVPILPFLSMPGLTELDISDVSAVGNEALLRGDAPVSGSFYWESPLMSVEDMRRRLINRPAVLRCLHIDGEVKPLSDYVSVLRLLPQLQDLDLGT